MRLLRWKSHNIKLIILNWAIQCHLVLLQCCIQPPPLSSSETVLLLHSKTSHQSAVPPHFSLPLQPSVCIFVLMGLPILEVYIESYNMWPFTFGFFACMCAQSVTQSCLTLCDLMDCSPPGSSVHEISQARILEWVAISFSRGSSWSREGRYHFLWKLFACLKKKTKVFFFSICIFGARKMCIDHASV